MRQSLDGLGTYSSYGDTKSTLPVGTFPIEGASYLPLFLLPETGQQQRVSNSDASGLPLRSG